MTTLTGEVGLSGPAQIGLSNETNNCAWAGALAGLAVWPDAAHLKELTAQWQRESLRFDAESPPGHAQ